MDDDFDLNLDYGELEQPHSPKKKIVTRPSSNAEAKNEFRSKRSEFKANSQPGVSKTYRQKLESNTKSNIDTKPKDFKALVQKPSSRNPEGRDRKEFQLSQNSVIPPKKLSKQYNELKASEVSSSTKYKPWSLEEDPMQYNAKPRDLSQVRNAYNILIDSKDATNTALTLTPECL